MEASKISVNPELLKFRPLTLMQQRKIREQRIIELIRSKPAGTKIKLRDFAAVIEMTPDSTARLIHKMIERKKLSQFPATGQARKSYTVLADVKVQKAGPPAAVLPDSRDMKAENFKLRFPPVVERIPTPQPRPTTPPNTLVQDAKEFSWQFNSDSLREFVAWAQSK